MTINPFNKGWGDATKGGGRYFEPRTVMPATATAPAVLAPAHYKVQLKLCKLNESRQTEGLVQFIAEFDILESDNPNRAAGTTAGYVVSYAHKQAQGNVKDFVATCFGVKFEAAEKEHANALISEAQPGTGTILSLVVDPPGAGLTRLGGQPKKYCPHTWTLIEKSATIAELTAA